MDKKIVHGKFKKTIKSFIKDEDGFVNKDKILKIGLGTVASLSILGSLSDAYAQAGNACNLTVHTNGFTPNQVLVCAPTGGCQSCAPRALHIDHSSRNVSGGFATVTDVKGFQIHSWTTIPAGNCPETFK